MKSTTYTTKEYLQSWLIAIGVSLLIFLAMTSVSYADNAAAVQKVKDLSGQGSWIQRLMIVGSTAAGVTMMCKNHFVGGMGTIAGVWGALGLYNSDVLF